ncbi:MAG: HlyD family secretion protein [Limisphaerales bacterium]
MDAPPHAGRGPDLLATDPGTASGPTIRTRAILLLLGLLCALTPGCSKPAENQFQGYLEADYVHAAAPVAGILLERPPRRGDFLTNGAPLFVLESAAEQAAVDEADARLAQSRARLANLGKGRRPSEIAALEARLAQAHANRDLADLEFTRRQQLRRQEALSESELDVARSRRDAEHALVASLEAEIETARLAARPDEIRAAESEVAVAEAAVRKAQWARDQKSQKAPINAVVHDTLFEPGEFVPAGAPVLTLLPPGNLEVRFYIPQSQLPKAVPGSKVSVHLDGLDEPIPATIRSVATRAEFTPPVIFSRETRQKLVFRVRASLDGAFNPPLRPGQPVDVRWPNPP